MVNREMSSIRGMLPIAIFLLLVLTADVLVVPYFSIFGAGFFSGALLYALVIAQAGVYCVMGGTLGRAWISSFLIATLWAILACLSLVLGMVILSSISLSSDFPIAEAIVVACGVVPLLMFCGCLPFFILRSWRGWHLHRNPQPFEEPYSLRMGDIFLTTTLVAALLAMAAASIHFSINDAGGDGPVIILNFAVFSTIGSSIAVVPVTIAYFKSSTRRKRAIVLLGFGMSGVFAFSAIMVALEYWSQMYLQSILASVSQMAIPVATASTLFSMGLLALHASGYRRAIVKPKSSPETVFDVLEQPAMPVARSGYRRRNLFATVGIIAGSIALSVSIGMLQSGRVAIAQYYAQLNSRLSQQGGYVEQAGHRPIALKLAPSNDRQAAPDLSRFKGLKKISLAGSQVNEDDMKSISRLKSLTDIDLSDTTVDDPMVAILERGGLAGRLSLAGTRVTIKGIQTALDRSRFLRLDIGNLNIDDSAIAQLPLAKLRELVLRGNPITDQSIKHLSNIERLDLSQTQCNGTGFNQLSKTVSLVVDNTTVDDAAIRQLLTSNKVLNRISLRNTQVTDASITMLSQTPGLTELELGDGNITPEGLVQAGIPYLDRLALNSRKFNSSLFVQWNPRIKHLDMSNSGVTDDDIAHLSRLRDLVELSLANCNISDDCLPKLAALGTSKMDLSGTKVTATAVAKCFPKTTVVYLSPEQCQPEELSKPNPDGCIRIGLRLQSYHY